MYTTARVNYNRVRCYQCGGVMHERDLGIVMLLFALNVVQEYVNISMKIRQLMRI